MSTSGEFLQFVRTGEVPVRSLDILGQPHDVITVAIISCSNHAVKHELKVLWGGSISNEEETGLWAQRSKRHGLANDLYWLSLLPTVSWKSVILVIKHTCVEKISHRDWIQKFQFDWLFYCLTNHFYKILTDNICIILWSHIYSCRNLLVQ